MGLRRILIGLAAVFSIATCVACIEQEKPRSVEKVTFSVNRMEYVVVRDPGSGNSNSKILAVYPLGTAVTEKPCFYSEGNESQCPPVFKRVPMTSPLYFSINQELKIERNLRDNLGIDAD